MEIRTWSRVLGAGLFVLAAFGMSPASAQEGESLEGSHWAIVEVYGEPLPQEESPHVAFGERGQLSGRTACNWFHGTYSAEAESILLLTRLTTLRGCLVGNRRQRDPTLEALDSTQAYAVVGRVLTFSDGGGEPVARLERVGDE